MLSVGQKVQFPSSEIETISHIQSSSTSFIYKGQSLGKSYMLKSVPSLTPHLQELQFQEFTNTKLIGHDPHIITLLEQGSAPGTDSKVFLMEYAENETLNKFLKNKELNEEQILFIFKDIVLAVIKVNDSGIVHRDIHPRNVWIDAEFNFKLSGFERSLRVDDPRQINVRMNCLKLTHPCYRPPDLDDDVQLNKVDVWGLGCLLFYLIYRDVPFGDNLQNQGTSPILQEILTDCLQPDPSDRPFPRKILNILISQSIPAFIPNLMPTKKAIRSQKYSAKHSILSLINSNIDTPDLFFLQQISFETWTKTSSIPTIIKNIASLINGVTLNDIKIIIVVHRLMLSGPNEMLCSGLMETLERILQVWVANEKKTHDEYFCEFYNGLIKQTTRNLIEKVKFHNKNKSNCSWKAQIPPGDFQEAVVYLGKIIRICEGLSMGMDILPQINSFFAMQLIEECQRLIMCISSLDKTNELQKFKSRLSALNFDPPSIKKSKFDTAKVKLPSPRNNPIQVLPKDTNTSSNPLKYPELLIPEINPSISVSYPEVLSPKDQPKAEFSKSSMNFSNFNREEPPAKPVLLMSPKNLTVKKEEKTGNMDFADLLNMDLLDFNKPAAAKSGSNAPAVVQPSSALLQPNSPMKVKESSPIEIEIKEIDQPLKHAKNQPSLENLSLMNPNSSNMNNLKVSENSAQSRSNSSKIHKRYSSNNISTEIPAPSLPKRVENIPPVAPKIIPPSNKQKPPNVLEIDKRWIIQQKDIKLGPVLGQGASCTVYRGEYKRTPVAIKIMMGTYAGQNIIQEFQREVSAMISLRHPNLVLFMGASVDPQMMIISEFCSGESLFKLLHEKRNVHLSWNQKFKMIIDIARGMLYLHEAQPPILHRDLKSLNLLLMDQINGQNDFVLVKVTDFGIARILDEVTAKMTMQVGTCHWMAPEVINSEPYSLAADIYSFGIVLWEIAARDTPYKGINPIEIPIRVLKGERPDLNKITPGVPQGIKDLITCCWDQSPQNRPTFRQIIGILEQIQGPIDY